MYRSWQHLIIHNETGLQDPGRIRKLSRADGRVGWIAIFGFIFAGFISVFLAIFLMYQGLQLQDRQWSFVLSGLAILVMSAGFFAGAWLFRKEQNLNPLRGFLKNPEEFAFIKGELEDCHYFSGQSRRQDVIIVEGYALGPHGEQLIVREEFSPRIWNFTTPQAERSLQKGSDWYDMKGKRRLLPVPAYFICRKMHPSEACLIGIDKEYLSTQ